MWHVSLLPWLGFLETSSLQPFSLLGLLLVLTLAVTTLMFINKSHLKGRKHSFSLIPSPPNKLPIIGHLRVLGGIHPHRDLRELAQKHGDLMFLQLGPAPTLVVSSAKYAKEILKTHDHAFGSRPVFELPKKLFFGTKGIAMTPYSEYWRQVRKICILQLLSPSRVQSFRSVREEEAVVMIDKISSLSSKGTVVNLTEILMSFTNDIICRVAFKKKYTADESERKFLQLVMDVANLMGTFNIADIMPWLSFLNNFNGLNAKVEKTVRAADEFLGRVIEEHIQERKEGNSRSNGGGSRVNEDLVDVLLGIEKDASFGLSIDRDAIKGVILDMFVAGTDTSETTLVWAMAELLRHPEIMNEVQEEVRRVGKGKPYITEDDIQEMHYLELVVKETLRLHPSVSVFMPHESINDTKIEGYDIPAKTRVIINAWAIARNPNSWKEAERFDPKRFLNCSTDYKGQSFEFIPFGSGRRICPGITFATYTIRVGLANLLYRYDWKLPGGARGEELDMVEAGPGLITHKKNPLLVIATDHL